LLKIASVVLSFDIPLHPNIFKIYFFLVPHLVALKEIELGKSLTNDQFEPRKLSAVLSMDHKNVATFYGIAVNSPFKAYRKS
jgi:hypothetical protein